jgi:6-phosphogluconolactonase
MDPGDRFVLSADLGIDKVLVSRLDAERGVLVPNDPPSASVAPGSGPRHLAFSPDGKNVYVINEMASTLTAFAFDGRTGKLGEIQTLSTLPGGFSGSNTTAEVQVHPSGRFVYGSNRGHDSLAIFRRDAESGKLTPVGHEPSGGRTPRGFAIEPTGTYLLAANQDSDDMVVFRIDPETGKLTQVGEKVTVGKPVSVEFVPAAP